MFIFGAVTCELLAITLVVMIVHEHKVDRKRWWIWGGVIFLTALNGELGIIQTPVIVQYCIFVVWIMLSFKCRHLLQCGYETLLAYAALVFFEILTTSFFPQGMTIEQYELSCLIGDITVLSLLGALYIIFRKNHIDITWKNTQPWQKILIAIGSIVVLIFCIIVRPILDTSHSLTIEYILALALIISIIVAIIENRSVKLKYQESMKLIDHLQKENQEFAEQLEENALERHEYAKRLHAVEQTDNSPLTKDYIIKEEKEDLYQSLQPILRHLLRNYERTFEEQGIKLEITSATFLVPVFPMSDDEIVSVFGNIIENAIEAVCELPVNQRWIRIEFSHDSRERFRIQNPYKETMPLTDKIFERKVSSKGKGHGSGLYIARRCLNKYDGEIRMAANGREFEIVVEV